MSESPAPSSVSVPEETDTASSEELLTEDSPQIQINLVQALPAFVKLCKFMQRKKMNFPTEPGRLLIFIGEEFQKLQTLQETEQVRQQELQTLRTASEAAEEQIDLAEARIVDLTRQLKEARQAPTQAEISELRHKLAEAQRALEAMAHEKQELRIALHQKTTALEQAEALNAELEAVNSELRENLQTLGQRFLDQSGPHHSTENSEAEPAMVMVEIEAEISHPSELSERVEDHHFELPVANLTRRGS